MPTNRSYVGRYFQLVLDGTKPAGYVKSVEYGGIKGELLAQPVGGQPWKTKHIHNPTIEPVTIQVGMAMSADFFDWVAKSWRGEVVRKNGSIITYDHDLKPVYEYEFKEALILETKIPALDGSSKDPAFITVKFQPEVAEHKFMPGGSFTPGVQPAKQKAWSPANFRLDIAGLDVSKVAKVDEFTVKQNAKPMACGPDWMYQFEPTSLEYPNLSITFSASTAQKWFEWHKAFVIDGQNGPDNEKIGSITMHSPNYEKELFSIELRALGMVNLVIDKADSTGNDAIRRVKAELYCEEMTFKFTGGESDGASA